MKSTKAKVGLMTALTTIAGSILGNPYLFYAASIPKGRPTRHKLTELDTQKLSAAEEKRKRKQARYSSVRTG